MPYLAPLAHRQQPFTASCGGCGLDHEWVATLRDTGSPPLPAGNRHAGDSTWLRIDTPCPTPEETL